MNRTSNKVHLGRPSSHALIKSNSVQNSQQRTSKRSKMQHSLATINCGGGGTSGSALKKGSLGGRRGSAVQSSTLLGYQHKKGFNSNSQKRHRSPPSDNATSPFLYNHNHRQRDPDLYHSTSSGEEDDIDANLGSHERRRLIRGDKHNRTAATTEALRRSPSAKSIRSTKSKKSTKSLRNATGANKSQQNSRSRSSRGSRKAGGKPLKRTLRRAKNSVAALSNAGNQTTLSLP